MMDSYWLVHGLLEHGLIGGLDLGVLRVVRHGIEGVGDARSALRVHLGVGAGWRLRQAGLGHVVGRVLRGLEAGKHDGCAVDFYSGREFFERAALSAIALIGPTCPCQ